MQAALSTTPAVLTIELDPRAAAEDRPPEPLTRDAAEVIAGALADDLRRIIGEEVAQAGLVMPGALYDLTEILRPGLPMVELLLDVYRSSLRGDAFSPHVLALGAAGRRFPIPELAPRQAPGSGPLLALPFSLFAPGPTLEPLRSRLESALLESGRPSLRTDQLVRQQFGLQPVHLVYATFHDLAALMRVQLTHAGFAPLWTLLEGALYRPDQPLAVDLETGNRFLAMQGRVWTPVVTFDDWATGHAADGSPVAGYARWVRQQRQYTAGLSAHGLEVIPTAPREAVFAQSPEEALSEAQRAELADRTVYRQHLSGQDDFASASIVSLTEQATGELGPFAYSALVQAGNGEVLHLSHEYPLTPEAIATIRNRWRDRAEQAGAAFHLERPGRPTVSGDPPRLMPFLDYDGEGQGPGTED